MTAWRFERPPQMPLPQPAEEAEPFFEALRERRLVVQRCSNCGALAHPPRAMCAVCQNTTCTWQELSGRGVVHSYVVTHQAVHPAFAGHTPLATVEVQLEEGPRLVSNLLDVPPEEVCIGLAVQVVFEEVGREAGESVILPFFQRAEGAA